jgi:predicted lipid-binding transport protein (Tim44 family)
MKKTIAGVALSLALMSSSAMAQERAGDAALGALSGAVVLGPIGAVAGAVIGYTAGPSISSSWGLNRSSAPRQARRAASRDVRVPTGDSQPVPNRSAPKDQAAPQAAAPARPSAITTASTAPPVQALE